MVHAFVKVVTAALASYAGVAIYQGYQQEKRVTKLDYYLRATEIIQANRYLDERLGKPIDVRLRVGHRYTIDEDLNAHFLLNMKGLKNKGIAFITADRTNVEEDWVLQKIEIANPRNQTVRMTIFEREPSIDSST